MRRLAEFNSDRIRMTREGFLEKHSVPVILHRWEPNSDEGEFTSTTAHISMIDLPPKGLDQTRALGPTAALGLIASKASTSLDVVVFPIAKRSGAVFHDRVSVGRSRGADIQLPFRRISKFHAYFSADPGGSRFFLTDAGSTNGTFIGGKRVSTGQPVEVAEKAIIHFSHFLFVFFTPAGFYSLLSGES